ncbi:PAS domain S-box protein [Mesoterricola silvestris]|uniref:Uncharacterized protein n=1 Tax=Mesoterricola silvestris TaxID=2927979 RepID=A0AA48K8W3_9BACT|nr:PAS domain S-box protein [Mesoterricola silvestris]BDU72530.1 hypothetical protein METEAL_17040 [Mesoterricola silvestris]
MELRRASLDASLGQELFEATSDLVLVTDPGGIIVQANRRAALLLGDAATVGAAFWVRLGLACDTLEGALRLCSAQVPRFSGGALQADFDIRVAPLDGGGFLVLLAASSSPFPPRAERERQVKDRAQALALARSQKMLHTVFQGVGKGIILVDEDLEVIGSNQKACETFGIHPENIQGAHIRSLCDPRGQETVLRMLDTIIENQVLSDEVTALYFDKSSFPAVFTVSLITVEGSRLWIIITEDISGQKEMERQLKSEKVLTEEANIALRNVLKNIQLEQEEHAAKLSRRITRDLLPILHKIRSAPSAEVRNGYIDFLGELLASLAPGAGPQMDFALHRLSKTEMKVCNFILAGFSTKEICATMNLAFDTVQTHRKNIRRKLGLSGSAGISLHGYLNSRKTAVGA